MVYSYISVIRTNRMHYLLSIYLTTNLYIFQVGLLLLCIYSIWYVSCVYIDWLLAGSITILPTASQHKRMTYINCCIYTVVPPDYEQ